MYADTLTGSMQRAMAETERRRRLQLAHNRAYGIAPVGVTKTRQEILQVAEVAGGRVESSPELPDLDRETLAGIIRDEMLTAAARMEFETAARLRDRLKEITGAVAGPGRPASRRRRRRR
jgi:excinuclease ABC subunit B